MERSEKNPNDDANRKRTNNGTPTMETTHHREATEGPINQARKRKEGRAQQGLEGHWMKGRNSKREKQTKNRGARKARTSNATTRREPKRKNRKEQTTKGNRTGSRNPNIAKKMKKLIEHTCENETWIHEKEWKCPDKE